ncbi:MAG: hypothetical protein HQL32_18015, partial [Planctomycetes bacterium]|nr:hypothetical protein [Planctomycetota bacterium]
SKTQSLRLWGEGLSVLSIKAKYLKSRGGQPKQQVSLLKTLPFQKLSLNSRDFYDLSQLSGLSLESLNLWGTVVTDFSYLKKNRLCLELTVDRALKTEMPDLPGVSVIYK